MPRDSKERIIAVAEDLLARQGYGGMGLKAISDGADLPYGSIYHHFPDGKDGIAATSIARTGQTLEMLLDALFKDGVTPGSLGQFFGFMADRLENSGWTNGCPIASPASDGAARSPRVREACEHSFADMRRPVERALLEQGASPAWARDLASTIVSAYEGATIQARVYRSRAPLEAAEKSMVRLIETVLDPR